MLSKHLGNFLGGFVQGMSSRNCLGERKVQIAITDYKSQLNNG